MYESLPRAPVAAPARGRCRPTSRCPFPERRALASSDERRQRHRAQRSCSLQAAGADGSCQAGQPPLQPGARQRGQAAVRAGRQAAAVEHAAQQL